MHLCQAFSTASLFALPFLLDVFTYFTLHAQHLITRF